MIYLNLQHILENKGIDKPVHYLSKNGFTYSAAHRLLNNVNAGILFRHMEKLCLLFNCTPNDILVWAPENNTQIPATHPIQKLRPKPSKGNITRQLDQLPTDKLDEIRDFIEKISKQNPKE